MPKFEVDIFRRLGTDVDVIVDKVAHCDIPCHWRFEWPNGQVIERATDDYGNLYFQMGRTLGAKGKVFLATGNDSDAISLRMKLGL